MKAIPRPVAGVDLPKSVAARLRKPINGVNGHVVADQGGLIVLGEAPGLGITFDEEQLAQHAVEGPSSETLEATYRRAVDSRISEPGIPVLRDAAPTDGRSDDARLALNLPPVGDRDR